MKALYLVSLVALGSSVAVLCSFGCTGSVPLTVLDACRQYKAARDCDAKLRNRAPIVIRCDDLEKKFRPPACSQADIDYAYEAFKRDAEHLCSFRSQDEVANFKSAFDKTRVSSSCNRLTE